MEMVRNQKADRKGLQRQKTFPKGLKEVIVRKPHPCEVCQKTIPAKEKVFSKSISTGDWYNLEWNTVWLCSERCRNEFVVRLGNKTYKEIREEV